MEIFLLFLLIQEVISHETSRHEQPFVEETVQKYCFYVSQEEFPTFTDARRDSVIDHALLPSGYCMEVETSQSNR